jgi:hypothetical protein
VLIRVDYQGCQSALSSQGCPPGLEGFVNDVEALQRLLIDRYQFRPEHITVLVNQTATKPKILTTLAALHQTTTAALMEGLSGKADDTKTGRITVTTLDL